MAKVRVAGRVVSTSRPCLVVETAEGVRWNLLGAGSAGLERGEQVILTGSPRPGTSACGGVAVLALDPPPGG